MTLPVTTKVVDICVESHHDLQREMKAMLQMEAPQNMRLVSVVMLSQHNVPCTNGRKVYTFLIVWEWI